MTEDTTPKEIPEKRGRGGSEKGAKRKQYGGRMTLSHLEEQLTGTIAGLGVVVSLKDDFCGPVVLEGAEDLSKSLIALAKQNDSVKRALEKMVTVTGWSGVIMASMNIALPILAHHGGLPPNLAANYLPTKEEGGEVGSANLGGTFKNLDLAAG